LVNTVPVSIVRRTTPRAVADSTSPCVPRLPSLNLGRRDDLYRQKGLSASRRLRTWTSAAEFDAPGGGPASVSAGVCRLSTDRSPSSDGSFTVVCGLGCVAIDACALFTRPNRRARGRSPGCRRRGVRGRRTTLALRPCLARGPVGLRRRHHLCLGISRPRRCRGVGERTQAFGSGRGGAVDDVLVSWAGDGSPLNELTDSACGSAAPSAIVSPTRSSPMTGASPGHDSSTAGNTG
jgi:hypothetical protein